MPSNLSRSNGHQMMMMKKKKNGMRGKAYLTLPTRVSSINTRPSRSNTMMSRVVAHHDTCCEHPSGRHTHAEGERKVQVEILSWCSSVLRATTSCSRNGTNWNVENPCVGSLTCR